jgi:hypothetical protein
MRTVNIVFELKSFFWNTLLNELSKPCTLLSLTNMNKNTEQRENKEVSRWMSHSKHRITHSIAQGGQGNWWQGLNRSAGVRVIAGDVGCIGVGILQSL